MVVGMAMAGDERGSGIEKPVSWRVGKSKRGFLGVKEGTSKVLGNRLWRSVVICFLIFIEPVARTGMNEVAQFGPGLGDRL